MKHTLSRLRYAGNLESLKYNYDRFLIDFKKNYPLGTEVQMIDHYINHYKISITAADRNIDRNQKSLDNLNDEEYEKLVVRTENHVFNYGNMVKWLEEKKETVLKSGQSDEQKPEQNIPKFFEELFYNTDLVAPSIDVLKQLEPPLIDTDCNLIGTPKGSICVWIDELQRQGIVKSTDGKTFSRLINAKINNLSISESMFRKNHGRAETRYALQLKTAISRIKA